VWAALPLGRGIVADPFSGSGSTIAAAEAVGYQAIGCERSREYYEMSLVAIPQLAALTVNIPTNSDLLDDDAASATLGGTKASDSDQYPLFGT
jgi:site-specific DNA-methyltransferase (adenine-specific)